MIDNEKVNPSKFDTVAVHAGALPDPVTLARAIPIHRSSSFVFKSARHASDLFALKDFGYIYSRLGNPTNDVLEKRMAELEGGAAAIAVSSGTAAIFNTIITIAKVGDEIVSASNLYGGTYTMFDAILPDLGISTRFVDARDPNAFKEAIGPKTRLVYLEAIGNPGLDVADIRAIADIAHNHGLPLVVDATFTTPYLLRPIEYGADIVIHSLTKWIGGHGTAIGGIVVDSGRFDWAAASSPAFIQADKNYHGIRWGLDLPDELRQLAFALRFRTVPLRNLGACLSPDNAWIFLQGLESLALRMAKHSANALQVANYLKTHQKVAWIRYPGLTEDPSHKIALKYLKKGYGGMVVFGVKGGRTAGEAFIEKLTLFSHLANVGDAKSLALHPASTSHSQLSDEQLLAAGVPNDLIRLSIGIEDSIDIIADIDKALRSVS